MNYVVAAGLVGLFALLLAILLELGKIRSSLEKLLERTRILPEAPERRQTVTVNVGAVAATENSPVKVIEEPVRSESDTQPAKVSVPEEVSAKPAPRPVRSGGVSIVKCPHCGAENTSFRTECFQCSKKL